MRIQMLQIKNFRNFQDTVTIKPQIVNGRDIVVLIGENNVGKTSILMILHQLFSPEKSIRTLDLQETDFHNIDEPIEIRIEFANLSEELSSQFIGLVDVVEENGREEVILPLVFTCIFNKDTNESEPSLVFGRQSDRNVSFVEKRLLTFYFQDALRDFRAIKSNKGSLFGRILQQIDLTGQEKIVLEKLEEASESLRSNEEVNKFVEGVTNVTKQIINLSNVNEALRLSVAATSAIDIKKNIQLQLRHKHRDAYLNVEQLGLGLQSVLTVSIFRAFAGTGQLKEGIFAIDEPESHLYPHSQRSMYREILELSKMRQVWVATHSPSLLEWINPRQICLVRTKGDGNAICIQLPIDFPEEHITSYEKHLDVGKADAFFAKVVILVEGPTEQGLIPTLGLENTWLALEYDLDRSGISVINANGKNNIKALIKLLNNFEIPSVALIDYDSKDKNHEAELSALKELTSKVYELPRSVDMGDIEGYLCLNAPISELIAFLQSILAPEKISDLFSDLKGAVNRIDSEKAEKIKELRKAGEELISCISIVESVPEAEPRVRKALADALRKIKGRTTGRLIGERFHLFFHGEFIKRTIDEAIELAGYKLYDSETSDS